MEFLRNIYYLLNIEYLIEGIKFIFSTNCQFFTVKLKYKIFIINKLTIKN